MVLLVGEVLQANRTVRRAYLRVLSDSTGRDVAKKVICLLWLEMTMGFQFPGTVVMTPDDISLTQLILEACAVYDYVLHGCYEPPPAPLVDIPAIVALCGVRGGRLVDSRFFMFHKDIVARGVAFIRDTIAALIFDDYLHVMLYKFEDASNSPFLIPTPLPAPELIVPFVVHARLPPEDCRTAFVAIPEYDPLSSQDILEYFERRLMFGPCIERIDTEQPGAGQAPKHCVIVFRSAQQRNEAIFEETAAFFRVNIGDMWVQRYMPPLCDC